MLCRLWLGAREIEVPGSALFDRYLDTVPHPVRGFMILGDCQVGLSFRARAARLFQPAVFGALRQPFL